MIKLVIARPPIPLTDVANLEELVRAAELVYSPLQEFNWSALSTYFQQEHQFGASFHAILDRNVLTQLVQAAKGVRITEPTQKASCALLAFFQVANVLIEPGVGMVEYADSSDSANPADELSYLRAFDNVHPQLVTDLALGRVDRFHPASLDLLPQKPLLYSSGAELNEWRLQYCFALKIAMLERTKASVADKLVSLMEWMWRSFSFGAVALTFAGICFSRKFSGLLKGIGSSDVEKALKGIRNAAWDLMIVQYFTSHVINRKETDPLYVFCTHDRALRFLAKLITTDDGTANHHDNLAQATFGTLTQAEIEQVHSQYLDLASRTSDPTRDLNRLGATEELLVLKLHELEAEFKATFTG